MLGLPGWPGYPVTISTSARLLLAQRMACFIGFLRHQPPNIKADMMQVCGIFGLHSPTFPWKLSYKSLQLFSVGGG